MLKSTIEYDREDLKVVVNDQKLNISVLDYIKIENKYEWYLKAVRFFGNFATFEHIATIFKAQYSETKIFKDLNNMCKMHLLKKEALGNYIYFVLTKKAQRYLKQRNNVGHISNPSDKALKSNLFLLDYLINDREALKIYNDENSKNNLFSLISDFDYYEEYIRDCCIYLYSKMIKIENIKKSFLIKQVNTITKNREFIKLNGKSRHAKYCDDLSRLMSKNVYLTGIESKSNNIKITFLIQDIGRSVSWYKNEILNIEAILREFYFNPIRKYISYDLIIQTDSIENKNNLSKVQNLFNNLMLKGEKYIKKNLDEGLGEETLLDYYLLHLKNIPLHLNNISIVEYNTVRFFETRSDKINTIDNNQINIVNFTQNNG